MTNREKACELMADIETLFQAGNLEAINEKYFQKVPENARLIGATLRCAYRARENIKDYRRFMYQSYIWLYKHSNPKEILIGMNVSQGKVLCSMCDEIAVWWYAPHYKGKNNYENNFFCDDHVLRGCSCNSRLKDGVVEIYDINGTQNPASDYEYEKDSFGRDIPCIEYDYSKDGFDILTYIGT